MKKALMSIGSILAGLGLSVPIRVIITNQGVSGDVGFAALVLVTAGVACCVASTEVKT
jgi:hypothetical protein